MSSLEQQLQYADRVARVWAVRYRVSPITGRTAGYLLVCDPPNQSIDDLAEALRASRSAVAGAVKDLEARGLLRRGRPAGERVDRVQIIFDDSRGFDPRPYQEAATLASEGMELLSDHSVEQQTLLENTASLNTFLAERLPLLLHEWRQAHEPEQPARPREQGRSQ